MERRSLRDNCNGYQSSTIREAWSHGHPSSYLVGGAGDYTPPGSLLGGLSWPPRSYTCSFCKREFRSAQALGGHMNVHRRDRARLRESPPWEAPAPIPDPSPNTDPNPNPNRVLLPNLNREPADQVSDDVELFSTLPAKLPQVPRIFPSLLSPLTHLSSSSSLAHSAQAFSSKRREAKNRKIVEASFGDGELKGLADQASGVLKRKSGVKEINMEMGMRGDLEDLDLELRLGYA